MRVVHCRHSAGSCRAFSAWVSALSLRGSSRCALTLTKKVRAPLSTLSLMHSMIDVMMSTFASPASVVRGPLPIHLDTLLRAASLSHKYSRSTSNAVACKVRAIAASSGLRELTPSSSLPHELLDYAQVIESGRSLLPSRLCLPIHPPPKFLQGSRSTPSDPLPCPSRSAVRDPGAQCSARLCRPHAPMPHAC